MEPPLFRAGAPHQVGDAGMQEKNAIFLQHHVVNKRRIKSGVLALDKPLWYQLFFAADDTETGRLSFAQTATGLEFRSERSQGAQVTGW